MGERIWPPGISPSGKGLRIRIHQGSKCIYSETLAGDAHSKAFVKSVVVRQKYLQSRLKLGLPLFSGDESGESRLFSEAAQEYLELLDCSETNKRNYLRSLNYYWMPEFASTMLHEIKENMIKRALKKHEISWKTQRNALTPLIGVFDHAKVAPNPARIKIKKGQKRQVQRYTPAERQAILDKLEGPAKAYFAIAFACGLRPPSEIIALSWDRWDGETLLIDRAVVRGKLRASTKTNVARRVYVPTWARPYINGLASRFKGNWLFPAQHGGHLSCAETFNKRWTDAHKKARIPYRIPYTCRHTRAAELLSSGSSRYAEMAAQMGHSLQMFLNVYSELIAEYSEKDNKLFEGVQPSTADKKLTK